MITLSDISKKLGMRVLFEDVTFTFNSGNRYGLTGPNGSGKSTLLKIMMGTVDATSGHVSLPKRVGFLRQNIEDFYGCRVIDAVMMGNERLWGALTKRDLLYEQEITDAVGMKLAELEEVIADEDGYSAEAAAEALLDGMGIPAEHYERPLGEIPSDLQFRVMLCQALFGNPEALLLDEPTNHLDLESIGWLEGFLTSYPGTLVVVSHDRHFLNAVTTHIADIDYETIIVYTGNYDDMLVAKTSLREQSEREAKSREKKIAQLQEFVRKFGAGSRASQVQSRVKEINRLQPQELKKSNIDRPYIRFKPPEKQPGKVVLTAKHLVKGYGEGAVIDDFSLEVMRGDKIGVIGSNGRGKTTLLKLLAGVLKPESGSVKPGHNVELGYFPQIHEEVIDKSEKVSGFDWLKARQASAYDQDIRGVLGKMLFSGDEAFKEIGALSGGETARLIFGLLMLQEHNLLILDEPNNHLDLESVGALAWGLSEFKGTVLVASHDRDLIQESFTKLIALEADGIHVFDGPLSDYMAQKTV